MSRASRVARGAVATVFATLLAAASHALAGGTVTWLAVFATAVLALPLGVALAGRLGSLWRLSLAIITAQFLFHWSFVGLGVASSEAVSAPFHSHHAIAALAPAAAAAGTADATMWVGHVVTAIVTIALLHRGEQAFISLLQLAMRALPLERPQPLALPTRPAARHGLPVAPLSDRLLLAGPISHRGPPIVL